MREKTYQSPDERQAALELWSRRYTVREFTNDDQFAREIDHLCKIIGHIPIQQAVIDHLWVVLSPQESALKQELFENYFCYLYEPREHMLPILTAPYLFIAFLLPDKDKNDQHRNVGLHAGVLLAESLRLGLDVATIGCLEGLHRRPKSEKVLMNRSIRRQIIELVGAEKLQKYFRSQDSDDWTLDLNLAVCVGRGKPLTRLESEMRDGFYVVTRGKPRKPFANVETPHHLK